MWIVLTNAVAEQPYPDTTAHMYRGRQPLKQTVDRLIA